MTAFLRLNGLEVPVRDRTPRAVPIPIGESLRAVDGSALRDWRAVKRSIEGAVVLSQPAAAIAWRDLMLGAHDTWSFEANNMYSAKGRVLGTSGTVAVSGATVKFGSYALSLAIGSTVWADFAGSGWDPNTAPWSVAFWKYEGGWAHYVETSAGTKWVNGATSGHAAFWAKSTDKLTFTPTAGSGAFLDDVAIFPFVVPDDWPAQMYAFNAALPDAPELLADGLAVDNNIAGGLRVLAELDGDPIEQARMSGALVPNAQGVAFRLAEV